LITEEKNISYCSFCQLRRANPALFEHISIFKYTTIEQELAVSLCLWRRLRKGLDKLILGKDLSFKQGEAEELKDERVPACSYA